MDSQPHYHLVSRQQCRVGAEGGAGVQQAQPGPDRPLGAIDLITALVS
jgi:hypothetical protein